MLLERRKRISITYRTVRRRPCECRFPEFCDWAREGLMARPEEDASAERLERKYVNQVRGGIKVFNIYSLGVREHCAPL